MKAPTPPRAPGIVLIGNFPPPFGGVPRHLHELAPFLASRGWRVCVVSPGPGIREEHDGFMVVRDDRGWVGRRLAPFDVLARTRHDPARARWLPWRHTMPARAWLRAVSIADLTLRHVGSKSVDLIAGYGLLNGAPPAALLSDALGVPLVVTNFGEIYSHRPAVLRQREFVARIAQSARLTAITRHCADSFTRIEIDAHVTVLPYGIDVSRFDGSGGEAVRQRLGIPAECVVAAFVGRLMPDMGLDTVLEALPSIQTAVPEAVLLLAGADGSLRATAEKMARRAQDRLHVLVDVPESDLPHVIAAADVVMCPTAGPRACGSLAAIEAMASGKAVVAARVGGIPEIVTDDTAILVEPGDPATLAAAIAGLLRDADRRARMGIAGRDRARRLFDRAGTNAAIEAFFRAAVTSAGRDDRQKDAS